MRRLLLAMLLGLLGGPAFAQPVKVGDLGILADAPFYIAIEKGYFKEANVEVTLERFQSAAQATARSSSPSSCSRSRASRCSSRRSSTSTRSSPR